MKLKELEKILEKKLNILIEKEEKKNVSKKTLQVKLPTKKKNKLYIR